MTMLTFLQRYETVKHAVYCLLLQIQEAKCVDSRDKDYIVVVLLQK